MKLTVWELSISNNTNKVCLFKTIVSRGECLAASLDTHNIYFTIYNQHGLIYCSIFNTMMSVRDCGISEHLMGTASWTSMLSGYLLHCQKNTKTLCCFSMLASHEQSHQTPTAAETNVLEFVFYSLSSAPTSISDSTISPSRLHPEDASMRQITNASGALWNKLAHLPPTFSREDRLSCARRPF